MHVFISYVRDDQKDVDRLVQQLRLHGVDVWLDREKIKPGQRWRSAIRTAIREGGFFIACFSESYAQRDISYMNEELLLALDELRRRSTSRIWFIPVRLSETTIPDRELGGGETLHDLQWVDLYADWQEGVKRIVSAILPSQAPVSIEAHGRESSRPPLKPDTSDLAKVGWGLIFPSDEAPEKVRDVTQALEDLISLRKTQAGRYFKICQGELGYHKGDCREKFLLRHGSPPAGRAKPEKLPYYLLLVGDPKAIPYEFQYELDVQYAVGRIWFKELEEYSLYAKSAVVAEERGVRGRRRAVFFAPSNPQDPVSYLSSMDLATLLADWAQGRHAARWSIEGFLAADASRERLQRLLGGGETPDFLFTAGHGLVYPRDDLRQRDGQGALVCQDWPGPRNPIYPDHCFAAQDLDPNGNVEGLITFHFSCDSAGTSTVSNFAPGGSLLAAKESFIAPLPQKLLTHPNGSALAVIGHVGTAWTHSIQRGQYIEAFEEVVDALLAGKRVGAALEAFGVRYADQAVSLSDLLQEERDWGIPQRDEEIIRFWTGVHDTRSFIVLGDPAVRLSPTPAALEDRSPGEATPPWSRLSTSIPRGDAMSSELVYFNGIYAETGDYLLPPMSLKQAAELARQVRPPDVSTIEDFRIWLDEALRGR